MTITALKHADIHMDHDHRSRTSQHAYIDSLSSSPSSGDNDLLIVPHLQQAELSKRSSFCSIAPNLPAKSLPVRKSSVMSAHHRRYFRPSLGIFMDYINRNFAAASSATPLMITDGIGNKGSSSASVDAYLQQIEQDGPRMMRKISDEIKGYELLSFNEFTNLRKELDILCLRNCRLDAQIRMEETHLVADYEQLATWSRELSNNYSRICQCLRMSMENVAGTVWFHFNRESASMDGQLWADNKRLREKCGILSQEIDRLKQERHLETTEIADRQALVQAMEYQTTEIENLKQQVQMQELTHQTFLLAVKADLKEALLSKHQLENKVRNLERELEQEHTRHLEESAMQLWHFNQDLERLQEEHNQATMKHQ